MKPLTLQTSPRLLLALAGASLLSISSSFAQQTIYSDTYTGVTNNDPLAGRVVFDTNATGAAYVARTRIGSPLTLSSAVGNPAGSVNSGANGAGALSLASGGSFTRVANAMFFTITADLSLGNVTGSGTGTPGSSTRGVGLGFISSPFVQGTNDFVDGLTGFSLQNAGSNNGVLQFIRNGTSTGFANLSVLSGTLSTSAFYTLSFTVDTSTGNLVAASFNGADVFSSFNTTAAGAFTDTATAFAGFGASSGTGGATGNIDNFSVVAVPEPSIMALAPVAIVGLAAFMRRRRTA